MNLRVKLDSRERGYYSSLYQALDQSGSNSIGGAQTVQFFKKSGLSVDVLKKIWLLSSSNNQTLDREEFYVALKLISFAQNNIELSHENILKGIPSPNPQFTTEQEDVFKIKPEQERVYQGYAQSLELQNNQVNTKLAINLYQKAQLNEMQIQAIMNLIEPGLILKPKMTVYQYIVGAHLIALVTQGIQLPYSLPKSLVDYISQYQVVKDQNLFDFDMKPDKSPANRYSAFNIIEPTFDQPIATQSAPVQNLPLQTPQAQTINQNQTQFTQKQDIKQNIDLLSDITPSLQPQQQPQRPPQQAINKQQSLEIQEKREQSYQTIEQFKQEIHKSQIMFDKLEVEDTIMSENIQNTQQLLVMFREQNERCLQQAQTQIDSFYRMNEAYKTIIKKIQDENEIFEDEIKNIDTQKKKSQEQLIKSTQEFNQKQLQNQQLKQELIKMSQQQSQGFEGQFINIIQLLVGQIEQEKKSRQAFDSEVLKEIKQQNEKLSTITKQISELQRRPSQVSNYKFQDSTETNSKLQQPAQQLIQFQPAIQQPLFDDIKINNQINQVNQVQQQAPFQAQMIDFVEQNTVKTNSKPSSQINLDAKQQINNLIFSNNTFDQDQDEIKNKIQDPIFDFGVQQLQPSTIIQDKQDQEYLADQIQPLQNPKVEDNKLEEKVFKDFDFDALQSVISPLQGVNNNFDFQPEQEIQSPPLQQDQFNFQQSNKEILSPQLTFDQQPIQFEQVQSHGFDFNNQEPPKTNLDFGFDTFKSADHNEDIKIEFDANAEFGNNNIEWNEYENNFGKDAAFKW